MRIHSDHLTVMDFTNASRAVTEATGATVYRSRLDWTGSRSRLHGITLNLEGDGTQSRRRANTGQWGGSNAPYAATYDQWGYFIAHLFSVDPDAIIGNYQDAVHFHAVTGYKFAGN